MKLINLIGSPHGAKGNTARLLRIVAEGAESQGATTETIFLTGRNVLPCLGCDACHKTGKCVQKDAFEQGKKLVLSWKEKAVSPENEKTISSFKERMRSLMLWRKDEWPYEYRYWKTHRGLE